jgi:hypothetical protein
MSAVSVIDMRVLFLHYALSGVMLVSIPAGACQCAGNRHSPESTIRDIRSSYISSLGDKDVVIEGVVDRQVARSDPSRRIERMWQNYRLVTVRAIVVFRGPKQEMFEVETGLGGGDCGFEFETGERYLIYARRNEEDTLLTSMCSETKVLEYAGADLRILRGEPPAPEDSLAPEAYQKRYWAQNRSRVCGRVIRSNGMPASGATLRLVRERHDGFPPRGYPSHDWSTNSKSDGAYCFEYVPRGLYFLFARQEDENDARFAGVFSKFWRPLPIRVEAGKAVNGLTIMLHRDLLYSARKHTLLGSIIAGSIMVVLITFWRWKIQRAA